MARIRTIKPEFFTSEDIVELSPLARLLYVALWCEADREGRLQWKPRTFKMRYFPADDCDIDALCAEILGRGLAVVYGDALAYIPEFKTHQHVNPRESESTLPAHPVDNSCVFTRADASIPDMHAQVGREWKERKGREGVDATNDASETTRSPKGSRVESDWVLPKAWGEWAMKEQPTWSADHCRQIGVKFGAFWQSKTGKDATKLDWFKTWQVWVLNEGAMKAAPGQSNGTQGSPLISPAIAQTQALIASQALSPEEIEANKARAAAIRAAMPNLKVVA